MSKFFKSQIANGNLRKFSDLKATDKVLVVGKNEPVVIETINHAENWFTANGTRYENIDIRMIVNELVGKNFKAIQPVKVTHERGTEFLQTEGTVTKVENNRVFLKGMFFEFNISLADFHKFNKFKS